MANPKPIKTGLKPFQKGQTGNPNGRPKGRSLTARLRDLLDAVELGGVAIPDGKQVADLLAEAIVKNALEGDHRFVATVLDRVEGKVVDKTEVTGKDGVPLGPQRLQVEFIDPPERTDQDPNT